MDTKTTNSLKVLMFPWLAYGHISPHLGLAKKLTDRGFSVYLCSTPINLRFIRNIITEKYSTSIHLVELHLAETPELPAHYHTTNGLPPHLTSTVTKALYGAEPDFSDILKNLKPDLVIYDFILRWTAALTALHNIPAVGYSIFSAAALAYVFHLLIKPGVEFPFPAMHLSELEKNRALRLYRDSKADVESQPDPPQKPKRYCDSITLVKSSREIEGRYMDYLSEIFKMKIVPVGTLIQEHVDDDDDENNNNELIQWLGTKAERSTVFAAFGSEYFLTKEEMEEVAFGLELSNVNFIWVVRFPVGEKIKPEEALPEGLLERVNDRGRIVEGWAPQAKILRHPSVGAFISHCGWSSVVESIEFGVPIIAMPMQADQPTNAKLGEELGVAVEVMRDENGKLERDAVAKVIKDVVVERMGENMRGKMKDLREKIKLKEQEELDEVAELLKHLCEAR